jgi:hypothetical protein
MPPPTPSTAPARSVPGGRPTVGGSKTDLKSIKKNIICLTIFRSVLGAMLEPFSLPFCSIFGLRSLLDTHLYQKRGRSRKPLKTNEKSTFLTSIRLGNRPQIAPRRLQEVICSLLNLHLDLGSIFAPFWLPKCLPLGTLFAPKIDPKNHQKSKCPKVGPRPPNFAPRSSQEAPRDSQESPKKPKKHPKRLQKHQKELLRTP